MLTLASWKSSRRKTNSEASLNKLGRRRTITGTSAREVSIALCCRMYTTTTSMAAKAKRYDTVLPTRKVPFSRMNFKKVLLRSPRSWTK